MAKKYKAQNSVLSFVTTALFAYVIGLPLVIALLMSFFGSIGEIITQVVSLIPFGESFFAITIQIINTITGQAISYNTADYLSWSYIFGELAKGLFTVIIFEALKLLICIPMGFMDEKGKIKPEGFWNKGKYLLVVAICSLVAACLAPLPINYILDNLQSLGSFWAGMISSLVSAVLVGGGIFFFMFLKSISLGIAIAYVLVKYLLVDACSIAVSYVMILAILIGLQKGFFLLTAESMGMLLALSIMLSALDMLFDNLFS